MKWNTVLAVERTPDDSTEATKFGDEGSENYIGKEAAKLNCRFRASGVPETILIVDDERIVAKNTQMVLRSLGYRSEIAVSGEDAIKKAAELRPDLVLMDIVLKGSMDGIEVAGRIAEAFGIPVIYITGQTDEATLRRARASEQYGYLVKPYDEHELRAAIEATLRCLRPRQRGRAA